MINPEIKSIIEYEIPDLDPTKTLFENADDSLTIVQVQTELECFFCDRGIINTEMPTEWLDVLSVEQLMVKLSELAVV